MLRLRDQTRLKKDVIGRDPPESERFKQVRAVDVTEQIEGGLISERWARVAVDMRHHEVDIGLYQPVEGGALRQDHAGLSRTAISDCHRRYRRP